MHAGEMFIRGGAIIKEVGLLSSGLTEPELYVLKSP